MWPWCDTFSSHQCSDFVHGHSMPPLPAYVGLTEQDVVFNIMANYPVASTEYLARVHITYVLTSTGETHETTIDVQVSNDLMKVALERWRSSHMKMGWFFQMETARYSAYWSYGALTFCQRIHCSRYYYRRISLGRWSASIGRPTALGWFEHTRNLTWTSILAQFRQ